MNPILLPIAIFSILSTSVFASDNPVDNYTFEAGHKSLQTWLLPDQAPYPEGNKPTKVRVELGKKLFFDPRLSGDGNMSCATCHSPMFGWSDGLPTAKGVKSKVLGRASPVITNTAFNSIQMWDGRKKSLEDQAMGPMEANVEMNMDIDRLFKILRANKGYVAEFETAYPGEGINATTLSKAIASYERTIISNNSPFDQWVKGDKTAMNEQQIQGFKLFLDSNKGNCATCHDGANFTDNGFHNLGLASWGNKTPDMGRYSQIPLKLMKGAFKTPTIRDTKLSAPYFHDGSAKTLIDVVKHYNTGGAVKAGIDPNMKELKLSDQEMNDIVAFMEALTSPPKAVTLPILPLE